MGARCGLDASRGLGPASLREAIPTTLPVSYQLACLAADLVWGAFLLRLSTQ